MKYTKDGCTTKVKVLDNGGIVLTAVNGYNTDVDELCCISDNGNGYYVTTASYSSVQPNHVFNLDYNELEYLYYAYKALKKSNKV